MRVRQAAGLLAVIGGAAASLHSLRETAGHIGDEAYGELDVPEGKGHVPYHLAREAFTTAGAMAASVASAARLTRPAATTGAWLPLVASTGGYLAGQWSGKVTAGSWAPSKTALAWHAVTSGLFVAGAALLRPRR